MTIKLHKNTGRRIGYARVSTDKHTTDQQIDALYQAVARKFLLMMGSELLPGKDQDLNKPGTI